MHSEGNRAKILPAVLEYLDKQQLKYEVHHHGGAVIVDIPDSEEESPGPGRGVPLHDYMEYPRRDDPY